MIELGKKQILTVKRIKTFGVYLGCDGEDQAVLLPAKYVPEGSGIGDEIEVFVYRDSQDRLVATTLEPKLRLGETAVLEVKEVGKIGAFLDWGLEKDLFLPFKEQTWRPESGQSCLVALYIDKSHRLCATMKVYEYLKTDSDYQKNDYVEGIVYQINEHYGAFVAVDGKYDSGKRRSWRRKNRCPCACKGCQSPGRWQDGIIHVRDCQCSDGQRRGENPQTSG